MLDEVYWIQYISWVLLRSCAMCVKIQFLECILKIRVDRFDLTL